MKHISVLLAFAVPFSFGEGKARIMAGPSFLGMQVLNHHNRIGLNIKLGFNRLYADYYYTDEIS